MALCEKSAQIFDFHLSQISDDDRLVGVFFQSVPSSADTIATPEASLHWRKQQTCWMFSQKEKKAVQQEAMVMDTNRRCSKFRNKSLIQTEVCTLLLGSKFY